MELRKSWNSRLPNKCGLQYILLYVYMAYIVKVSAMSPSKYIPINYRVNKWIVLQKLICDMIISYNKICTYRCIKIDKVLYMLYFKMWIIYTYIYYVSLV